MSMVAWMRTCEKNWKRGRVVYGSGLENRRRLIPPVSSNLTASANYLKYLYFLDDFIGRRA
jgi:hypothetical protein